MKFCLYVQSWPADPIQYNSRRPMKTTGILVESIPIHTLQRKTFSSHNVIKNKVFLVRILYVVRALISVLRFKVNAKVLWNTPVVIGACVCLHSSSCIAFASVPLYIRQIIVRIDHCYMHRAPIVILLCSTNTYP